jgi:hypothetical protein
MTVTIVYQETGTSEFFLDVTNISEADGVVTLTRAEGDVQIAEPNIQTLLVWTAGGR